MEVSLIQIILITLILLWLLVRLNTKNVYWFYREDCGYCSKMEDEWKRFEDKCFTSFIRPIKININEKSNYKYVENFDVGSVPYIVKIENDLRIVYDGDRTAESFYAWC